VRTGAALVPFVHQAYERICRGPSSFIRVVMSVARRSDRRLAGVVAAVFAVPTLILFVRAVHNKWVPASDWAGIEARTRDVGTRHTPFVGAYSRYGWSHPGPMLFYVLAMPYRMLGAQPNGLLAGALAINVAAGACVGVILWRRGGIPGLTIGLVVLLLTMRALGTRFLLDPWNPYVIALPLFALVMLAWAATNGDRWALPVAVGVGSFVVQSHVGAALAVGATIAFAVAVVGIEARHEHFADIRPVALATFGVALVCWISPLVEQFQPHGGNLGRLLRFWRSSHATTGWAAGSRIVAQQLAIPAPWFTGHEHVSPFTGAVNPHWQFPVALVLLVGATAVAHDRRSRADTDAFSRVLGRAHRRQPVRLHRPLDVDRRRLYVARHRLDGLAHSSR